MIPPLPTATTRVPDRPVVLYASAFDATDGCRVGPVICSNCGTANPAGAKFCTECATRLAAGCPTCGTVNAAGAKFCGECGTALAITGDVASATRPAARPGDVAGRPGVEPVAERRLVSVLFADLVGFTPFAEERDAEDVRDTLTSYFDLATDVIGRYGGTVEKFIGDAVMAVWGTPTTREDDAERAVRAALDLVDAVRSLGPGIQARAGVLTGEAAVTIGATNQGMVAGDLVNTAARLQSVAAPGTVLVGETTHRAAGRAIAFEEAGEQVLKGKKAPVPAWRALRVVAERGGRGRGETLEAPFVGRDEEFRLIKDLFHASSRERRARLVSVIGPAGIGKSRLAWEFLKYVDGLLETVWWHAGRAPAYGEGISFWSLGEMIRGRCGLLETDDEATTRAKVAETVARIVPDEEERRWVEPSLLSLLGIGSSRGSEQLFGAWRTFFERMALTGTVVMVFEDVHYADSGTLDFIDHLVEWSKNVPIYVITLGRPELLERRTDWGAGKRHFASIFLEPISESAMRELIVGLVPGLPASAVRAIVGRADGVPLYAVETIRMLVSEGRLAELDGAYVPVGDLTTLAIPETLTALIAARLDALQPGQRTLIQDAAVLGQSFTPAGLSSVSGIEPEDLEPELRTLVRRELLTLEADPRSPERGQYAFVQALIREVAYNTLAKKDRKVRHLAAARFFESLGSDELVGALASHYLAAHANAADGPEADALAGQARISLRAAVERAAALGAHDQAVMLIEQALTVTTEPSEEAELLERAGESSATAAHWGTAEGFYRRAIALQRQRGDRSATARATAALGRSLLTGRRTDAALELLESGAAEFVDLTGDAALSALEGQLARCYMLREDPRRAVEVAERVLEAAEHRDLRAILADTVITKGSALDSLGRNQEGIALVELGRRIAATNGFTSTELRALNNLSVGLSNIDIRAASEASRAGLALARRLGQRHWVFGLLGGLGYASFLIGDWERAATELSEGLADDPEAPDRLLLLNNLVCIRALQGSPADTEMAEMEALAAGETDPALLGYVSDARAFEALAKGDFARARDEWTAALELSPSSASSNLPLIARAALWAGDGPPVRTAFEAFEATGVHGAIAELSRATLAAAIAGLDGRTAEAAARYRDVVAGWADAGMITNQALTGIDMVMLLDPADPVVSLTIDATREVLERLGSPPLLSILETAWSRGGPPAASSGASAGPTGSASAEPATADVDR